MTNAPRKGSVDGLHGLLVIEGRAVRVYVDGDMPRGVVSWDCDGGWADVLIWDDEGTPVSDGENFVTKRVFGTIKVVALDE